jgi:hypothetical protein
MSVTIKKAGRVLNTGSSRSAISPRSGYAYSVFISMRRIDTGPVTAALIRESENLCTEFETVSTCRCEFGVGDSGTRWAKGSEG